METRVSDKIPSYLGQKADESFKEKVSSFKAIRLARLG